TVPMSFSINWTDVPEAADMPDIQHYFELVQTEEIPAGVGTDTVLPENAAHSFIEGDNYPCLRLLEKTHGGKINLIYIDPPYNTGKTNFTYNDSLYIENKSAWLSKDKYSAWLSFMSRRLECARNLLSEDGCIFISIGQESLYVLKLLCDRIFGAENFINDFMWLHGKGKKDRFSRTMQQSNLCYAKNYKKLRPFKDVEVTDWAKTNADGDPRGNWFSGSISFDEKRSNPNHPNYYEITSPSGVKWKRQWLISKEKMDELIKQDKIYWGTKPEYRNVPREKIFNGEETQIIPKNIIDGAESTRNAQNYVDLILGEKQCFDNPKPVGLIQRFIQIANMKKNIIVLDFFAGSGTTFEAVVQQNKLDGGKRNCILIQKPEKIQKQSRFSTISELCLARMKAVIPPKDKITCWKLHEKE
ncbi:site-specific DNA-methyltransferase, partial [uncultured Treponema sp.]|uniref:site-specific DNA-methyltransferase n=2 Tax=uncultured Treponema sp. TaxID=162155 RepID=UPI00259880CF